MEELKFKDEIDLNELLKGFMEDSENYYINSIFDEFISVSKITKIITQYGYNGLVYDWIREGLLEMSI